MDCAAPAASVDIFTIYQRYCDIVSGKRFSCSADFQTDDAGFGRDVVSREALAQLLNITDSRHHSRRFIFDEVSQLLSHADVVADSSKFSRFYEFVFFICRETGQKNLTVSRAISAWRLVLAGRFRLLHQWLDFVEKNQRYNISEDTWKQVLAFSRCVHENLKGYDPEGAWPVLIDDFVEYMYRINGRHNKFTPSKAQSSKEDDPLPGLKILPGLKRKFLRDFENHSLNSPDCVSPNSIIPFSDTLAKRSKETESFIVNKGTDTAEILSGPGFHLSTPAAAASSKSPCGTEGCLSRGFAELLSDYSSLQFHQERRVS